MKLTTAITAWTAVAASVDAYVVSDALSSRNDVSIEVIRRALPNSPKGYTPSRINCPADAPSVRSASSLSPDEVSWVKQRRSKTVSSMRDFLTRLDIPGFDAGSYIDKFSSNATDLPNIGMAFSGGGWRALLNGAGVLQAFDGRTANASMPGHLGGLLQSSTYVSGLSGGSWLVGSIFINNYTTVTALRDDTTSSVYEFGNSVLKGPASGGIQTLNTLDYYKDIIGEVLDKGDAGFRTSITDLWGRGLSFQLINATDGGPAYTWSSIALTESFQNADSPFPIILADGRAPDEKLISLNSTVFEFNPFEMGSWDPTLFGFVPTKYLGTNFTNGNVADKSKCVVGFDNAGFVMGTSSSLFNQALFQVNSSDLSSSVKKLVNDALTELGEDNNDIADYTPNPFYHYNNDVNPSAPSSRLTLVDGGEDLQNIPLHPLIQPTRKLDVIFAIDSSADTSYNWPNATALVATYERSLGDIANGTAFPSIPDQNTIVNLGLNTRPTFFGCNTSNMTHGLHVPLIVYIPHSPYVAFSNESTLTFSTNDTYRDEIILNGYNVATMGNGTVDNTWPTCVGCAILSRSLERTKTQVPDACTKCFERFCWDGSLNSTQPKNYEPSIRLDAVKVANSAGFLKFDTSRSLICVFATMAFLLV